MGGMGGMGMGVYPGMGGMGMGMYTGKGMMTVLGGMGGMGGMYGVSEQDRGLMN